MRFIYILTILMVSIWGCTNEPEGNASGNNSDTFSLELYPPPDNNPIVVSTNPEKKDIIKIIRGQEWSNITFVILKRDDHNWIEVSGSRLDGFSARYMHDSKEFVSSRPPESLDEMIAIVESYRVNDNKWKSLINWE